MMRFVNKVTEGPRPKLVGVYLLIHPHSGKVYVGSSKDILYRVKRHVQELRKKIHPNYKLQRAFSKSEDLLVFYVICRDRDHAYDVEQELLDEGLPQGLLFNVDYTARLWESGHMPSEETIRKVREANLGRKLSIETIEKMRQSKLGVPRPQWFRDKMVQVATGRKLSDVTREKMSIARKGKKLPVRTVEHIRNLAKARTGHRHSLDSITKIRDGAPNKRPVSINGSVYPSASEASRVLGIDHKTIRVRIASDKEQFKDWFYAA